MLSSLRIHMLLLATVLSAGMPLFSQEQEGAKGKKENPVLEKVMTQIAYSSLAVSLCTLGIIGGKKLVENHFFYGARRWKEVEASLAKLHNKQDLLAEQQRIIKGMIVRTEININYLRFQDLPALKDKVEEQIELQKQQIENQHATDLRIDRLIAEKSMTRREFQELSTVIANLTKQQVSFIDLLKSKISSQF